MSTPFGLSLQQNSLPIIESGSYTPLSFTDANLTVPTTLPTVFYNSTWIRVGNIVTANIQAFIGMTSQNRTVYFTVPIARGSPFPVASIESPNVVQATAQPVNFAETIFAAVRGNNPTANSVYIDLQMNTVANVFVSINLSYELS